jgi:hypothetical protein
MSPASGCSSPRRARRATPLPRRPGPRHSLTGSACGPLRGQCLCVQQRTTRPLRLQYSLKSQHLTFDPVAQPAPLRPLSVHPAGQRPAQKGAVPNHSHVIGVPSFPVRSDFRDPAPTSQHQTFDPLTQPAPLRCNDVHPAGQRPAHNGAVPNQPHFWNWASAGAVPIRPARSAASSATA